MTHYANITTKIGAISKVRKVSPWIVFRFDYNEILVPNTTGSITGLVTLKGIPMPYERVTLYYRPNGNKIATVLTGLDGSFTFTGLDINSKLYYAVSFLKGPYTDPEKYNALIYDLLQPL